MKKIMAIIILCMISFSVLATDVNISDVAPRWGGTLINDSASLLKGSTKEKLETRLTKLSSKYSIDVVLVTVENTGRLSEQEFADDYYDYGDFRNDGVLLLYVENPRGVYMSTKGKGIKYITDYGREKIFDLILPDLKKEDFAAGFNKYVDLIDEFFGQAKEGDPYDTNNKYKTTGSIVTTILLMLLIALLVAGGIVGYMVWSMNTVRKQPGASVYSKGLNLTGSGDIFLYSHTSSHRIQSSSSGGGSRTHSSSSGSSHGGGGRRF